MGRKPDSKGKDRPRTIVLSGDVAEIAQKLADKNELSRTLSELLRFNYGFGDAIEEKKRELEAAHEQRVNLQRLEESLALEIDSMENAQLEAATNIRPGLEKRRQILTERLAKTEQKMLRAFDTNERIRLENVIQNINGLIVAVDLEIEGLA